jgi:hypothetical protein
LDIDPMSVNSMESWIFSVENTNVLASLHRLADIPIVFVGCDEACRIPCWSNIRRQDEFKDCPGIWAIILCLINSALLISMNRKLAEESLCDKQPVIQCRLMKRFTARRSRTEVILLFVVYHGKTECFSDVFSWKLDRWATTSHSEPCGLNVHEPGTDLPRRMA